MKAFAESYKEGDSIKEIFKNTNVMFYIEKYKNSISDDSIDIIMKYNQVYSFKEVGDSLGINSKTVRDKIKNVLRRIYRDVSSGVDVSDSLFTYNMPTFAYNRLSRRGVYTLNDLVSLFRGTSHDNLKRSLGDKTFRICLDILSIKDSVQYDFYLTYLNRFNREDIFNKTNILTYIEKYESQFKQSQLDLIKSYSSNPVNTEDVCVEIDSILRDLYFYIKSDTEYKDPLYKYGISVSIAKDLSSMYNINQGYELSDLFSTTNSDVLIRVLGKRCYDNCLDVVNSMVK